MIPRRNIVTRWPYWNFDRQKSWNHYLVPHRPSESASVFYVPPPTLRLWRVAPVSCVVSYRLSPPTVQLNISLSVSEGNISP